MPNFILADDNMTNNTADGEPDFAWGDIWLGRCVFAQAGTQGKVAAKKWALGTDINATGPPGMCQGIFHGVDFELNKDGWKGKINVDEMIEISSVHPQFYQITQQQRENLEAKIKQGLATISQSVSDLELVDHDVRKYDEYKDYLNGMKSEDEKKREQAEFALKTVFVDTVDFHAGGGGQGAGRLSMAFMRNNNIMPTIVDDFMRMRGLKDIDTGYLSKLPDVEKRMLETKWTLYEEWLKLFTSAVDKRLERVKVVKKSREFTVNEYREWLKPSILRYKLVDEGFSKRNKHPGWDYDGLKMNHLRTSASATSFNGWTYWAWKAMTDPDPDNPAPSELQMKAIEEGEFGKPPFWDKWTKEELIYNNHHGLIADFPWITYDWVEKKAEQMKKAWKLVTERRPYYTFLKMYVVKSNTRLASGFEMEDLDFFINVYIMSPNVLLAKILEAEAKKQEMDNYVNQVLGLPLDEGIRDGKKIVLYKKEGLFKYKVVYVCGGEERGIEKDEPYGSKKEMMDKYPEDKYYLSRTYDYGEQNRREHGKIAAFLEDYLGIKFIFGYHNGPYERTFYERMTKFIFKYSQDRFDSVVNMIIRRIRVGEGASS